MKSFSPNGSFSENYEHLTMGLSWKPLCNSIVFTASESYNYFQPKFGGLYSYSYKVDLILNELNKVLSILRTDSGHQYKGLHLSSEIVKHKFENCSYRLPANVN